MTRADPVGWKQSAFTTSAAIAVGLVVLILSSLSTAKADWPGPAGRYTYVIKRDGDPIGQQSIELHVDGAAITVDTDTSIAVKFLGMTLYRMNQHIAESYVGLEMMSLQSHTDDDGENREVDLRRDGKMLNGTFNGEARSLYCDCMASTMWHAASVAKNIIVEASRARLRQVAVKDLGVESLSLPSGLVQARHMVVSGELEREVWYDASGILVASEQKGRDGSVIRQELLQRP